MAGKRHHRARLYGTLHRGVGIAELASLRWSDIDFDTERLTLTDETGRPAKAIGGWFAGQAEGNFDKEDVEPSTPEKRDEDKGLD